MNFTESVSQFCDYEFIRNCLKPMACRCLIVVFTLWNPLVHAQLDFEREPINYSDSVPTDAVMQLSSEVAGGRVSLTWQAGHGYLKAVLRALQIPQSSQTLVFSRTSLQIGRISSTRPRAIYFNDDVYVGWVQSGDLLEISAADPKLGATFYTLPQRKSAHPLFRRETSRCLQCHGSTHTRRIPGHIIRSVIPDRSGQPVYRLGTHLTDHRSPFHQRWGGWYVSGTHGEQRHMGNVLLDDPDENEELNVEQGANITDLSALVNVDPYLTPHSDIVALMVLQHQVQMHNVLTAANHAGAITERDASIMNKALERPDDFVSDSTMRRYDSAAERVVKALLFVDEHPLTDHVQGTSSFAEEFEGRGPCDERGRSLREFDLRDRLFRYPCSYLIYSDAFACLHPGVRTRVVRRLKEVLNGDDDSAVFLHLSDDARTSILGILQSTLTDF